jgi:hypothetical protein
MTNRNFPPPPPAQKNGNGTAVKFGKIQNAAGHRVVLYGPGGIGKTTLATMTEKPVAFFDLDDSLSRLMPDPTNIFPVDVSSWTDIRHALQSPGWDQIKTIVIDSLTKAEEMCLAHTIETVPHEKGHKVSSVEGYGFGKGFQHNFEQFLPLLADLDAHCRAGRHVVLICHDCTTTVPNPSGEDWLRYEPRLQSPTSGKASIRLRVREWADHVLFYGYDIEVKDGKGKGGGSRTIYPCEMPHCMAKSRTCRWPIPVRESDPGIWSAIVAGQKNESF